MRALATAAALAAVISLTASAASAASKLPTLPRNQYATSKQLAVRPTKITFNTGQAGVKDPYLAGAGGRGAIDWKTWTTTGATASGSYVCPTGCAAEKGKHVYAVTLSAAKPVKAHGQDYFTVLMLHYTHGGPLRGMNSATTDIKWTPGSHGLFGTDPPSWNYDLSNPSL